MRRRHRRLEASADLDITAFLNLMIVLVPVLLLNMVFAHTSVLELNFPDVDSSSVEEQKELQLQVVIFEDQLVVSDNQGGVIKTIANREAAHDFEMLHHVAIRRDQRRCGFGKVDDRPSADAQHHLRSAPCQSGRADILDRGFAAAADLGHVTSSRRQVTAKLIDPSDGTTA